MRLTQGLGGDLCGDVVKQWIERTGLDFYLGDVEGILDPRAYACRADTHRILGSLPGPEVCPNVPDDR